MAPVRGVEDSFKGVVAATVHGLSTTGISLADAYKSVAQLLDKEGFRLIAEGFLK